MACQDARLEGDLKHSEFWWVRIPNSDEIAVINPPHDPSIVQERAWLGMVGGPNPKKRLRLGIPPDFCYADDAICLFGERIQYLVQRGSSYSRD